MTLPFIMDLAMGQIPRSTERIFSFVNVYTIVIVYTCTDVQAHIAIMLLMTSTSQKIQSAHGAVAVSKSRFLLCGIVDLKMNIYFTRMSVCSLLPLRVIFQPNSQDYCRNRSCKVLYST